jgi:hypothetical protein
VDFLDENVGYLVTTSAGFLRLTMVSKLNRQIQILIIGYMVYLFDRDKGWSVVKCNEGLSWNN